MPWLSVLATICGMPWRCRPDLAVRRSCRSCWSICPSCCWRLQPASGCSMCSTSSRRRFGRGEGLEHEEAALHGSSYYDLPRPVVDRQYRHPPSSTTCRAASLHRLPKVLKDHPELNEIGRLTLWESLNGAADFVGRGEAASRLVPRIAQTAPAANAAGRLSLEADHLTLVDRTVSRHNNLEALHRIIHVISEIEVVLGSPSADSAVRVRRGRHGLARLCMLMRWSGVFMSAWCQRI